MKSKPRSAVIILTGPTAVGKTKLSLRLAREFDGEIISADSRQVYRQMDIGTAKPTVGQRARIPHHCLDLVDPDQSFSAGEFSRRARAVVADIQVRGKLPIVAGGSGLYISAFIDGFFDDVDVYPGLRASLEERLGAQGADELYAELGRVDPQRQQELDPADIQRILRALELGLSRQSQTQRIRNQTGTCLQEMPPLMLCLPRARDELAERINRRVDEMMTCGFLEEVTNLRDCGYGADCHGLRSLGYGDLLASLEGQSSLIDAVARIKRDTRQFAKRQFTWFRRDRRWRWLDVGALGERGVYERIAAQCERARSGKKRKVVDGGLTIDS